MNDQHKKITITVEGCVSDRWKTWFEARTMASTETGDTVFEFDFLDQAALFGCLRKVRDSGMKLLRVETVISGVNNEQ